MILLLLPLAILSVAAPAIRAAYLPSTPPPPPAPESTLISRAINVPGWVGQFATGDCSGAASRTDYYSYNGRDNCLRVDWALDFVGVNFGSGSDNFTTLALYADDACKSSAGWSLEWSQRALAYDDKQCFSQNVFGGPYRSVRMQGGAKTFFRV